MVDDVGRRANGHILFNQAKVRTGLACTRRKIKLAIVAVSDGSFGGHALAMIQSGRGQCGVPAQAACASLRARLVGKREQLLGGGLYALALDCKTNNGAQSAKIRKNCFMNGPIFS
jgi:hypothetical protein